MDPNKLTQKERRGHHASTLLIMTNFGGGDKANNYSYLEEKPKCPIAAVGGLSCDGNVAAAATLSHF